MKVINFLFFIFLLIDNFNITYCSMNTSGIFETLARNLIYYSKDTEDERIHEVQFDVNKNYEAIQGDVFNYKIIKNKIYVPANLLDLSGNLYKKVLLPSEYFTKQKPQNGIYNISIEKKDKNNKVIEVIYKVDLSEALRKDAKLKPIVNYDYLTDDEVGYVEKVAENISNDYNNKKLWFTGDAYEALLDIDSTNLGEYSDISIDVAQTKNGDREDNRSLTLSTGETISYFKINITYKKKDGSIGTLTKFLGFDEKKGNYYVAEDVDGIEPYFNNNDKNNKKKINESNFFKAAWKKLEKDDNAVSVLKKDYVFATDKDGNEHNIYFKLLNKQDGPNAKPETLSDNEGVHYVTVGHLSKPGIGTFTTVINDNAEYFRKNKYSIDSIVGKSSVSVEDFINNYDDYDKKISENNKSKGKKSKAEIKQLKEENNKLTKQKNKEEKIYNELIEAKNKKKNYAEENKPIYYDSNYLNNVDNIKKEIDDLEQGIVKYNQEKFELVDKNSKNSDNNKKKTFTILKLELQNDDLDNLNEGIRMSEGDLHQDDDVYYYSAKIKNHNYEYYESLDCFTEENFNPNNPGGASTSSSSGSSSGASTSGSSSSGSPRIVDIDTFDKENDNKTPKTFKLKRKNGVGNVKPAYFKLISRLLNLEKDSRFMGLSAEGFIIKIYAPGNKGILKCLIKQKHIPPPTNKDTEQNLENYPIIQDNTNPGNDYYVVYVPTTDNYGKFVDIENNFNDYMGNSKPNPDKTELSNLPFGYFVTDLEYNILSDNIKKYYTKVVINDVLDQSGNHIDPKKGPKKDRKRGQMTVYVFNRDKDGDKIKLKDSLKADSTATTDNHTRIYTRTTNTIIHATNTCNGSQNSGGGSGSSRKRATDTVRCPCNKVKKYDRNQGKNKYDNSLIDNKVSQLVEEIKENEYQEAINDLYKSESELIKASANLMNSNNDEINIEGGISDSGENNKFIYNDVSSEYEVLMKLTDNILDNISNPTVVKTRLWISRMNMFYNKMKKYLKNLKKISKLTGKKEDNDRVNNIISLKNSIYQNAKENLSENNLKLLNENGKPEGFQNNVNIIDQQSELEIDALNDCVSVISLYEDDNNQNIDGKEIISTGNDGLAVEIDDEGNFKNNIDVKSIDINASSYGEALEIITDKLLNRLDFADDNEKDSISRALGKIYRSLTLRAISDPDPDTTATLNNLYNEIYKKLTNINEEYKNELEPPMNTENFDYLSKRERNYNQKLNLVKDKRSESNEISKIDEVFTTVDGNTYSKYYKFMSNGLKNKLLQGIINDSNEIKNMVKKKLYQLSEIYTKLKQELTNTEDSELIHFENKLLEMSDIVDIYNDIYSVALTNGEIDFSEQNKKLLPLEPTDKMVKCLNVLKYNRMLRLLRTLKKFDNNLLPYNGMENKFNSPSYNNLDNHDNRLSLSDIFKNIENLDLPPPPLSFVVIFLSIFKAFDDYIGGLEEKYITNNAAKLLGKNSDNFNDSIERSLKVNSPLDRDPEDLYLSHMLSAVSDSGYHAFENEEPYNEIMADSVSSALSDLKSFTNDNKLLPNDSEVKVSEDTGEIVEDSLVDGENSFTGAMDYVNDKVRELNESDDPQNKDIAKKINKKLKKALKKAKKQLIKSVGHTSVSNIVKAAEYISALEKVVNSAEGNTDNISSSSSSFTLKIKDISKSYNSNKNNKLKKIRNRKTLKQIKKALKKLKFKRKN